MGIWWMTTHLAAVGGFMTVLGAHFVGPGVTLAAGALALAAFAITVYAASAELRRLRREDVRSPTEPAAVSPPAAAS